MKKMQIRGRLEPRRLLWFLWSLGPSGWVAVGMFESRKQAREWRRDMGWEGHRTRLVRYAAVLK